MPCFDKKLEASRSDFYMNKAETREVDCVITSGTVTTLMMPFLCMNVSILSHAFHCHTQGRFRKCWRRKMCLSVMWNLHPLMNCEICDLCLPLHFFKINSFMIFLKNRMTHTLSIVLDAGSAVWVGVNSWAMLVVGRGVTSTMSLCTLPGNCLERRWKSSLTRRSGESVSAL